ncbi:MAG: DEAD/DEAH box helicase [Rhodocyclaceae bacterium]|nr:DEAD/DEAH box helicase [Rhodocyclaceae bacterium]
MSGVVRVVTGGGKTIFAQFCIEAFKELYPEGRVVIVVPTTALLDQWVVSLNEDYGVTSEYIACYSADEKPEKPADINIIVINTARSIANRLSTDVPSMLIVDECHRAGSAQNALALSGTYAATLGLSATPEREYDEGFETFVKPALGPIIYEYDYVNAAKDGVISPFALHNVRVDMLSDEQESFDKLSRKIAAERAKISKGKGSEEKLTRLLHQRAAVLSTVTMRIPVAVKLAERHAGHRTIIFHERVDAANKLLSILRSRKRSATIYHAGIAPALRRDNLRLYRKGVFDILVCCRALDEGINVPETAVAILASSTASIRQRVQRLGRVLRPAPGKDFADIYTIYASNTEEKRLSTEAENLGEICKVTWSQVKN